MRKIEKEMLEAIANNREYRKDNTVVVQEIGADLKPNGNHFVFLHGNIIYIKTNESVRFSLCGWNTPTTRSRLNALGIPVCLRRGAACIPENERCQYIGINPRSVYAMVNGRPVEVR